jgi:hypothetical protein
MGLGLGLGRLWGDIIMRGELEGEGITERGQDLAVR